MRDVARKTSDSRGCCQLSSLARRGEAVRGKACLTYHRPQGTTAYGHRTGGQYRKSMTANATIPWAAMHPVLAEGGKEKGVGRGALHPEQPCRRGGQSERSCAVKCPYWTRVETQQLWAPSSWWHPSTGTRKQTHIQKNVIFLKSNRLTRKFIPSDFKRKFNFFIAFFTCQ